jgi:hypothetical protein
MSQMSIGLVSNSKWNGLNLKSCGSQILTPDLELNIERDQNAAIAYWKNK